MKRNESPYYPLFLNIRGKKCAVIGGGQVALRKVNVLLEHGANVEVISLELCKELEKLADAGKIQAVIKDYGKGDLQGCYMVIAATDDAKTNIAVSEEARKKRVLVNIVDDAENSDFIVPSCMNRGDVTIAVSTGGKSPALARKLRLMIEKDFGEEVAALALLVNEVRTDLKKRGIKVDSESWQKALEVDTLITLLKNREREKAKAMLTDNLKAMAR